MYLTENILGIMKKQESFIPLALAKFANYILASSKSNIKIVPSVSYEELPVRQSKFLGVPYWPKPITDYPKDKSGNLMKLMVQINFEDLKPFHNILDLFPTTGILQFFIPQNDQPNHYWGLSFNDIGKTNHDIVVIYHERIDLPHYVNDQIIEIHNSLNNDEYPIFKHCRLKFEEQNQFCPLIDYYASDCFYKDFMNDLSYQEQDVFYESEEFDSTGCKLDGYAYFTQADPRKTPYDIDNPWILLLQIDSVEDENGEPVSMWGDAGVANWFIRKKDLLNKDFSNILYNWDCH